MKTANRLRVLGDGSGIYIYRKGIPAVDRDQKHKRIGFWDSMDGRNYVVCPNCCTINLFDNLVGSRIHFDRQNFYGDVASCIVCLKCECHFFITLEDWSFTPTEDQKKMIRIVRRGLGSHFKMGFFDNFPHRFSSSLYPSCVAAVAADFGKISSVYQLRHGYVVSGAFLGFGHDECHSDWEPAVRKMVKRLNEHMERGRP